MDVYSVFSFPFYYFFLVKHFGVAHLMNSPDLLCFQRWINGMRLKASPMKLKRTKIKEGKEEPCHSLEQKGGDQWMMCKCNLAWTDFWDMIYDLSIVGHTDWWFGLAIGWMGGVFCNDIWSVHHGVIKIKLVVYIGKWTYGLISRAWSIHVGYMNLRVWNGEIGKALVFKILEIGLYFAQSGFLNVLGDIIIVSNLL